MGDFWEEPGSLSFLVRRAWLGMRAAIGAELKAFGLSTPQYATLMILEQHPGRSNSDIARAVASTRQAANEMLAGLERDGFISRTPHPDDRRAQQINLTASGRERLAEARVAVTRREAELVDGVSVGDTESARAWLAAVSDRCALAPDD